MDITPTKSSDKDEYIQDKKKNVSGYFTPPSLNGSSNNQGRTKTQQPTRNQKANNNNNQPQGNKIPSGMIECTFKGILDRAENPDPYLEVWVESNKEIACLYANGTLRKKILTLNLVEGDHIAIASRDIGQGQFLLTNLIQVAKAA